ncbi:stem 28 kDa glycoprotein-like isoform X2 [Ananas comosus]|uniref:Stem 28 kDa glycoprotein-like isoform X2 n=1 Tax=Ananas comosus TaxID=4615 RepID=A0A6P5FQ87_ANACO|nr:stem 28 kDa glycoprotein-like isoform X2 [Ananas comosus]
MKLSAISLVLWWWAAAASASAPEAVAVVHQLRPAVGWGAQLVREKGEGVITCGSWRVGVEANNVRGWRTIPAACEGYVGHYMLGDRYRQDSIVVAIEAAAHAAALRLAGNGSDVWVFDVDETALSNLPYYARHGFGVEPFNPTLSNAWVNEGAAPALPESLNLYKKLLSLGIKIVFLTGRTENQRDVTARNLKRAGYHTWEKLVLKGDGDKRSAVSYKSGERQKLENEGYNIVGNIGDQWSDILGQPEGNRTFKLPDPMYYIG